MRFELKCQCICRLRMQAVFYIMNSPKTIQIRYSISSNMEYPIRKRRICGFPHFNFDRNPFFFVLISLFVSMIIFHFNIGNSNLLIIILFTISTCCFHVNFCANFHFEFIRNTNQNPMNFEF